MRATLMRRLGWLEQISRHPAMRGLRTAVAVQLASRYINSKSGRAWPAHATLAKTLGANRRNIQRAVDALVDAGHLDREPGGGGRQTNTYRMRLRSGAQTAPVAERGGAEVPERWRMGTERGGVHATRTEGKNIGRNMGRAQTREAPVFSSPVSSSRNQGEATSRKNTAKATSGPQPSKPISPDGAHAAPGPAERLVPRRGRV